MNALCVDIRLGVYQCYCSSGYILIDDYDCVGESYTLMITLTLYVKKGACRAKQANGVLSWLCA